MYQEIVARLLQELLVRANVVVDNTLIPLFTICSAFLILISILSALVIIDPLITVYSFLGFGLLYVLVILITKRGPLKRQPKNKHRKRNFVMKSLQEGLGESEMS